MTIAERQFHFVMGALLFATTLVDPLMRSVMPSWRPPEIGFLTVVVGLVWIGRFAANRTKSLDHRTKTLEDRVRWLEDELERTEREAAQERDRARRGRTI